MAVSKKKIRTICVVTGSRADYGHSFYLLKAIQKDPALRLQLAVTGTHLLPEFGSTYKIILADGFKVDAKIHLLKRYGTPQATLDAISLGCRLFSRRFSDLKPDMVILFGDRFETLAACLAAYVLRIPIAHVHGGERSEGVIDEGFRHSITKMAHLHFAATEEYRQRIIRMGEHPSRVFNLGAPGQDVIYHLPSLDKKSLAKILGLNLSVPTAMVTYHPVTLDTGPSSGKQITELLQAIKSSGLNAVFTMANADHGGTKINKQIKKFCVSNPAKYKFFDNLGQVRYLSCLKHLDLVIGNSSSGLVEAPSFHIPTINIGDRQKGRVMADSVIQVKSSLRAIREAITYAMSDSFQRKLKQIKNPYARFNDGNISIRVKNILKNVSLDNLIKKSFYDGAYVKQR